MALFQGIANRIRNALWRDKDNASKHMAQGMTGNRMPLSGHDLLSAYGYDVVGDYLRLEHDLVNRYLDYESMDEYGEVSKALDIMADDATQPDTTKNRTVWVTSDNKDLVTLLDNLFHKTLRVDDDIWSDARVLCKYGNNFRELLVTQDGVVGANMLPPATMRRIEGPRGQLFGFVQDFRPRSGANIVTEEQFQALLKQRFDGQTPELHTGNFSIAFEDWEIVHNRLQGKYPNGLYGTSVLEAARWIWKRLMILEDSALIYRLQRSPEKLAFYVNTGDRPPEEAIAFVNQVRQMYRKKKYINPATGKLELKMDALSPMDDYFIPVDKDGRESTRIETVNSPSWQSVDDLDYFLNKLFTALGVPKAYLAQDADINRAVLSGIDVQFARSILRIQRELKNGLSKIARVHMAAVGIDAYDLDYDIHITTPSSIFELAQIEVLNARADLATRMQEHVTLRWLLSKVYHLSDDEVSEIIEGRKAQKMEDYGSEAEAQNVAAEINPALAPAPPDGGLPGNQAPAQRQLPAQIPYQGGSETEGKNKKGLTKRDLYEVNKYQEAKLDAKFAKVLKNDRFIAARLTDLGSLLQDLRSFKNQ